MIKLISASALFLRSFIMHDERRFEIPYVQSNTHYPSAVSLAVVEQSFYVPWKEFSTLRVCRRFGSTVRACGTKGLINKSNESINIQTVLREKERKGENSTCWRTTMLLLPLFLVMVIYCSRFNLVGFTLSCAMRRR